MEVHRPAVGNMLYLCLLLRPALLAVIVYFIIDNIPPPRGGGGILSLILLMSHSVHVNAADLHVICYSVNYTISKRCLTP